MPGGVGGGNRKEPAYPIFSLMDDPKISQVRRDLLEDP